MEDKANKAALNQSELPKQGSGTEDVDSHVFDAGLDFLNEMDDLHAKQADMMGNKQKNNHDNLPENEEIIVERSFTKADYDNTASFNFNEEIRRQMLGLSNADETQHIHEVQMDVERKTNEAEKTHQFEVNVVDDHVEAALFDFSVAESKDSNDLNTIDVEKSLPNSHEKNAVVIDAEPKTNNDCHTDQPETLFVGIAEDEVVFEGSDFIESEQASDNELNDQKVDNQIDSQVDNQTGVQLDTTVDKTVDIVAESLNSEDLGSVDIINTESNEAEVLLFSEDAVVDSTITEEAVCAEIVEAEVTVEEKAEEKANQTMNEEVHPEIKSTDASKVFQENVSEADEAEINQSVINNEDAFDGLSFELPESSLDIKSEETLLLVNHTDESKDDEFDFSEFEEDEQENPVLQSESDISNNTQEELETDISVFALDTVVENTSDVFVNQDVLDNETSINSHVADTCLFTDSEKDNETVGVLDDKASDVVTSMTEAKTDTELFKEVQQDNTQLDTEVTAKNNLPKAVARLLSYMPQRYFALPTFATIEIIEKPKITFIPCMKPYVYGMLSWQNTSIPTIDIGRLIMNDNTAINPTTINPTTSNSKTTDSHTINYALIVAYMDSKTKAMKHIAIALDETPSSVTVDDSMMADLPTDNPIWQQISVSCFAHHGQPVPIVNTNLLFG